LQSEDSQGRDDLFKIEGAEFLRWVKKLAMLERSTAGGKEVLYY